MLAVFTQSSFISTNAQFLSSLREYKVLQGPEYRGRTPEQIISEGVYFDSVGYTYRALRFSQTRTTFWSTFKRWILIGELIEYER